MKCPDRVSEPELQRLRSQAALAEGKIICGCCEDAFDIDEMMLTSDDVYLCPYCLADLTLIEYGNLE